MDADLPTLIAQLGFPIAVTIYLLWERSKVLSKLTTAIETLTLAIERMK